MHFEGTIAAQAFDNIVQKAINEVHSQYLETEERPLVVVVCAGWNVEPDKVSSMKEALCAKHLSKCVDTIDFVNWAQLHAGMGKTCTLGTDLPKKMFQTYKEDHPLAREVNTKALPRGLFVFFFFQR